MTAFYPWENILCEGYFNAGTSFPLDKCLKLSLLVHTHACVCVCEHEHMACSVNFKEDIMQSHLFHLIKPLEKIRGVFSSGKISLTGNRFQKHLGNIHNTFLFPYL